MKKRFLTIFIMPQDPSRVKQFKFPSYLLKGIVAFFGIFVLGLSFMVYDYIGLRSKVGELSRLKKENTEQKIQIQAFTSKVGNLEDQMSKFRQFDKKLRIIANIEPRNNSDQVFGVGGPSPDDDITTLSNRRNLLIKRMHSDLDQLNAEATLQENSFTELQEHLLKESSRLAATPSIWPARGWVASTFGYRISPFTGLKQKHDGIDIANSTGTPIISPANGVVVRIRREKGLGKSIAINHGRGIITKYGHLSKILVKVGERVKRGEKIAAMGNTGRSTGPHLHYEVVVSGVQMNPFKYILN
ncbi:MAG: M23 family metallopeptidase [Thermodesulfobacteriota bacterium]